MQEGDIKLKNILNLDSLKDIDFGRIIKYKLKDDAVFHAEDNTGATIRELVSITNILNGNKIKYDVDENYNIQVNIR